MVRRHAGALVAQRNANAFERMSEVFLARFLVFSPLLVFGPQSSVPSLGRCIVMAFGSCLGMQRKRQTLAVAPNQTRD